MADWSLLPKDLLHQISTHLPTSIDLLRFRSICTSWRSSTSPIRHRFPNPFPIPIPPNDQICYDSTGFHLCKRTIFLISLPYAYPRNQTPSSSSSSSCLLKIQQNNDNKHILLHPLLSAHNFPPLVLDLSKFRIRELAQGFLLLPQQPPPSPPYSKGAKVVIMMLTTHHHFLLLTIDFYGKLAVFISAHQQWMVVNENMHFFYCDVILYKGKLYAVDSIGRLVVIEYVNLDLQVKLVADSVFPANQTCYVLDAVFGGLGKYLVESEEGDLLLVAICFSNETEKSKVYRLDEGEGKWEEVKSLGDRVLFLGDDSNFCVSIDDHKFCRGNFVLFLNHSFAIGDGVEEEEDRWKVSVLDLENGCIGPLRNFPQFCNFIWPPPQWITSTTLELLEVSFTF